MMNVNSKAMAHPPTLCLSGFKIGRGSTVASKRRHDAAGRELGVRRAQARQVAGMLRRTISVGLSVRHDVESLRDPASPFETNPMHTAAIGKPNLKASVLRRSWPSWLK